MEVVFVVIEFNLLETIAFAMAIFGLGIQLKKRIRFLSKYLIPAPVIGGVVFSLLKWALRDYVTFQFDMTMQVHLMVAFFIATGLSASFSMLKKGGVQVFVFLGVASLLVLLQDTLSVALSYPLGMSPILSLLAGSITMSGGHGTGALYAKLFTNMGYKGCMEMAMAAATFGLVTGSIMGGPLARKLIKKYDLLSKETDSSSTPTENKITVDMELNDGPVTSIAIISTFFQFSLAMVLGHFIEHLMIPYGITLPTYLYALFVGIFIRLISDRARRYKIHLRIVSMFGEVSLAIFLTLSLMSLELWQLSDIAGPMLVILLCQALLMFLFAYYVTFRIMGRDYAAAVISGGHCGFGLGATPNAIANMDAIVAQNVPSPRAYFVVSIVGAFFIDITNAMIIQTFVSIFR